ncbi:unnamed protein product [Toxocara canis]|uniref:Reverse transcriptase n=1 Tax=Toxocara canis TaxID=6265 RepID=A0A183UIE4_TOXCA|nr:unnamed protein product [Toxocara canis]
MAVSTNEKRYGDKEHIKIADPLSGFHPERLQTMERDTSSDGEKQRRRCSAAFIGVAESCDPPHLRHEHNVESVAEIQNKLNVDGVPVEGYRMGVYIPSKRGPVKAFIRQWSVRQLVNGATRQDNMLDLLFISEITYEEEVSIGICLNIEAMYARLIELLNVIVVVCVPLATSLPNYLQRMADEKTFLMARSP